MLKNNHPTKINKTPNPQIKTHMKKIVILLFLISQIGISQTTPINLMSGTIKIPGMQYQQLTLAFAKGDKIVFNFKEEGNKEINKIEIFELPSNLKFSDFKTANISNQIITVSQTGIYLFRLTNASLSKRIGNISIQRVPKDESTVNFNSTVVSRMVSDTTYTTAVERRFVKSEYETNTIINKQKYFINSGSNATFKGGKSRLAIPITLPPNTAEWYYTFSSSRNEADINSVTNGMQLASELSNLIDQTGLLSFGVNQLTQPPGGNYCDVYLIDYNNYNPFLSKGNFSHYPIGTRENIVSGTVKVNFISNQLYLGIRNPDTTFGIHVVLEVVAITKKDSYEEVEVKTPHITTQEKLFVQD